jgi:hypothetical protein
MIVAQHPTQSLAATHWPFALQWRLRNQQDVAFPPVISLAMEMVDILSQRPPQRSLANKTTLDRHSSLTDRTQRSA